jgi:hypothetical protein
MADRPRDWLMNNEVLSLFQAVFVRENRTMGNIVLTKTTIGKYINVKRGRIYWCFVKKTFCPTDGEALWFK